MIRLCSSQSLCSGVLRLPSSVAGEVNMATKRSLFKETSKMIDSVKDVVPAEHATVHGVVANVSEMKKGSSSRFFEAKRS